MYKRFISLRSKSRIYKGLKRKTKYKRNKLPKIEIQTRLAINEKYKRAWRYKNDCLIHVIDRMAVRSDCNPIEVSSDPKHTSIVQLFHELICLSLIEWQFDRMIIRSDGHPIHFNCSLFDLSKARASYWHHSHNIYCILEENYANMTPFKDMAKFLRESRIAKALTDRTIVYESHVRTFWKLVRYDESEKMIYSVVQKKDENDQDVKLSLMWET
ncbi:hypothetical protein Hanom_Chr12g01133591 [Helianthus anomalus]